MADFIASVLGWPSMNARPISFEVERSSAPKIQSRQLLCEQP